MWLVVTDNRRGDGLCVFIVAAIAVNAVIEVDLGISRGGGGDVTARGRVADYVCILENCLCGDKGDISHFCSAVGLKLGRRLLHQP